MHPGKRLHDWRAKDGRTQGACAIAVGCSQAVFSEWESERKTPGIRFAFAIEKLTKGAIKARDWAAFETKGAA